MFSFVPPSGPAPCGSRPQRGGWQWASCLGRWPRRSVPPRTRLTCLTQRGQQCTAQASARQHIHPHRDGLRRGVCTPVVRILAAEASGNLCEREPPGQTCPDIAHHPRIQEFHSPEADAPEPPPGSAPCWHDRGPLIALRACSRLTVLGAPPNTVAIVRNAWPWASPRLWVSRSSTLTCV